MSVLKSRVKYAKLDKTDELEEIKESQRSTSQQSRPKLKKIPETDYYDDQFEDTTPIRVPIKSICIAIILFLVGTVMLTLGSLMLAGVIKQGGGSFRAAPLLVIGSIVFIPGAYNVRTAYYAWRGYHGFSYADMAGFGEDE